MSRIDRTRLAEATARERDRFAEAHPRSRELADARAHLVGGVPMTWMRRWATPFPITVAEAHGSEILDVDGHCYVDFCLGDTGAMAGHGPEPTQRAIAVHLARSGLTTMLPSQDAAVVADELTRRFGVDRWQFTLSATDANRFVLRALRHLTRRPYVVVMDWCYHGTVDETFAILEHGRTTSRPGNVGPAVDPATTTRVVPFNDLAALRSALEDRQVAAVLTEPALTNIGIVLPEDGYLAELIDLAHAHGTFVVLDETHTISAGPGGMTKLLGLQPDAVTIGKAIGGGVPIGAWGLRAELAEALLGDASADLEDTGGVGGTLAGNGLSLAAARATLTEVLTPEVFARMQAVAHELARRERALFASWELPWSVVELGARSEFRFVAPAPRDGAASARAADPDLDRYVHLALANRGVLLTPFHAMALAAPTTTLEHVERYLDALREALAALLGPSAG